MLTVTLRVYLNMKQCFHSKDNIYRESLINDGHINHINFDIVSGYVHVQFHNSTAILIRVWDNARSSAYVNKETFDSGVAIRGASLLIHSISPSFTLKGCHHAKVEVFIPYNYGQPLSLTGIVKMGLVKIDGRLGRSFGNIDITVELGMVDIDDITSDSLSVLSELGTIEISDTIVSNNARLQTHVGYIYTHGLITNSFRSYSQYGYTLLESLIADKVEVDTKFGYSKVYQASTLSSEVDIKMKTEYGHSALFLDSNNVEFNLENTKGTILIEYEDVQWVCKLEKSSFTLMNGKCDLKQPQKGRPLVKADMNTKYGDSNLVIEKLL